MNKRQASRRSVAILKSYRVNHVAGIDLIYVNNLTGVSEFWLSCICWGSNFQLVSDDNQKSGASVWKCVVERWRRFPGHPEILVVDSGTEFQGDFAEACDANGITLPPNNPKTPLQNGRTECVGHEWKRQFKHAARKGFPQRIPNS